MVLSRYRILLHEQEPIRHKEVELQAGLSDLDADANMLFGMSAMTPGGMTTGMAITECIYDPDESPVNIAISVQLTARVNEIEVFWSQLSRCDSNRRIIILSFETEVCVQGRISCQTHSVNGNVYSVLVPELEADTKYDVRVRANTTSGQTPFSDPQSAQPLKVASGELTGGAIAGIVMGMLTVCIFLGVVLFCYCRFRCKSVGKIFSPKLPGPLKPIARVGDYNLGASFSNKSSTTRDDDGSKACQHLVTQISDDSGYDQDSPPVSPSSDTPQLATEPSQHPAVPTAAPTLGIDSLDVNSFSNPGLTLENSPSQPGNSPEETSQESTIAPYLGLANVSSGGSISGPSLNGTLPTWQDGQQMVYFVKCDPPMVSPVHGPQTFPPAFPMPTGELLGPAEGGVMGGVGPQGQDADETACKVPSPSSTDSRTQGNGQPSSQTIASYVRLDGEVHDLVTDSLPSQPVDDDSSEDQPVSPVGGNPEWMEGVVEEPFPSQSARGGIEEDVKPSSVVGIQTYVTLTPANYSHDDSKPALADELQSVSEDATEEPQNQKEFTKMNLDYISYPAENINNKPAAVDEMTEDDQREDSDHADKAMAMLHAGYISYTPQSIDTSLALSPAGDVEGKGEPGSSESAEQASLPARSSDSQTISGQTVASSNGYVPFSSVPGAAVLKTASSAVGHSPEADDGDSSDGISSECSEDSSSESIPSPEEESTDEDSLNNFTNSKSGHNLTCLDKNFFTGNAKTIPANKEAERQTRVGSNGYVPWQSLPFHSKSPTGQKQPQREE